MRNIRQSIKPYILPLAIILGLLFHTFCASIAFVTPYLVFTILLLTFSAVPIKSLRLSWLYFWLLLFQLGLSIGCYYLLHSFHVDPILAEGVLIGVICPVAASVAVISCMMGANRIMVTTYTIVGNLVIAVAAPLYFSLIGVHPDLSFTSSFLTILRKIGPTIGLPFFIILFLQLTFPKANQVLARHSGLSFYLWACALLLNLGQTIDFIFLHGQGHWHIIAWLGVASLLFCILQFGLGKWLGHFYGDTMAGGQLLGQKNSAMGIWMANTFLHPLSSVFMAFYSVFQNVFNSWQLWHYEHHKQRLSNNNNPTPTS